MKDVRLGIIGVGVMGTMHADQMADVTNAKLVAVCDIDKKVADSKAKEFNCKAFYSSKAIIQSGEVDAVLIATPHYSHTTIGIEALKAGLHVLVEKPISAHKADCEKLIAAHKNKRQVFAAMFQQRGDPHYAKVRELIQDGELGEITRVSWIITNWFRSQFYYDSGGWRATWAGEGGGVLLNQCPHNLDLLQWIVGMPKKITAFCGIGKRHKIEVEDEVTAYMEFANGATGVFVTTTGEAPGSNRLEICGEMGKIVVEDNKITFTKNTIGQAKFSKTSKAAFARPETWNIDIPAQGGGANHLMFKQNFVDAIQKKAKLIAPAKEGIKSVELANAMLYSSMTGKTVDMPLNGLAYQRLLKKLIKESTFKKSKVTKTNGSLAGSF